MNVEDTDMVTCEDSWGRTLAWINVWLGVCILGAFRLDLTPCLQSLTS